MTHLIWILRLCLLENSKTLNAYTEFLPTWYLYLYQLVFQFLLYKVGVLQTMKILFNKILKIILKNYIEVDKLITRNFLHHWFSNIYGKIHVVDEEVCRLYNHSS